MSKILPILEPFPPEVKGTFFSEFPLSVAFQSHITNWSRLCQAKNRVLAPGWKYLPRGWRFPDFYLTCSVDLFVHCCDSKWERRTKCPGMANKKI